jgi:hypothetical protein
MEYNLIKTIETNYGYTDDDQIIMTPFPANLTIMPGIGQIVNNLSIVMPLHNNTELTNISKKSEFENTQIDQSGGGNDNDIDNSTNSTDTLTDSSKATSEVIPFNELKRKSMDETVYQSFMHPKMFKTNSLNLAKNTKTAINVSAKETLEKEKTEEKKNAQSKTKHKFNVYK